MDDFWDGLCFDFEFKKELRFREQELIVKQVEVERLIERVRYLKEEIRKATIKATPNIIKQ